MTALLYKLGKYDENEWIYHVFGILFRYSVRYFLHSLQVLTWQFYNRYSFQGGVGLAAPQVGINKEGCTSVAFLILP